MGDRERWSRKGEKRSGPRAGSSAHTVEGSKGSN